MIGRLAWGRGLAALSLGLFGIQCVLFWPFVADDAFIVGRYALNAADGLGLVYNPGERVSALTSPLHALLETGLALFVPDPVLAYRIVSPVLAIAGFVAAARGARLDGTELAVFGAFAVAAPFAALWTVGGLETPLLMFLVSVFAGRLCAIARRGTAGPSDFLVLGALSGLAFLTRFDSILVTLPPMLFIAAVCWRERWLWAGAALAAALAASWLGFSMAYYGDPLPTSAYAKLGAFAEPPEASVLAVVNFALVSGTVLLLPLLSYRLPSGLGRAIARGAVVALCAFLAYAGVASGQHMMFGYRLFVPYLPALGLIIALSIRRAHLAAAAGLLALASTVGVSVATRGLNPFPIGALPGIGRHDAEMSHTTPRQYGQFMATLRADAEELRTHWQATGQARPARIFLYTGGMGYWLRDFYVFETLVSYRHDCIAQGNHLKFKATDYVQDLGAVPMNDEIMAYVLTRDDVRSAKRSLSRTPLHLGGPTYISYFYGPDPEPGTLPLRITERC